MKKPFVVGCCDRKTKRVLILKYLKSPIAGPFTLHAVVSRS
jgi:hypothetical protein